MLNVERVRQEVNVHDHLVLSVDVSRDQLAGLAIWETPETRKQLEVEFENRIGPIEEQLAELTVLADQQDLNGLWVVCEPTGGLEQKLLRTARQRGHHTAYVNAEHVAKMSVIESGDPNKTDPSDARVISLVARLDRTQKDRNLTGEYLLLRELSKTYHQEDKLAVQARCRLTDLLRELFCDYDKGTHFLFRSTGQAVMEEYGWNPYRIVADNFEQFRARIKTHVKQAHESTIQEIWAQAQSSARQAIPEAYRELLERRLEELWNDYWRHEERKQELESDIAELYRRLEDRGEVPPPVEELTRGQLGRFIGQTGPLADFDHWRELVDYAGLKLRERESGQHQGEIKITKKGRTLLRQVLGQMAYTLARRDRLFGPYYRRKKDEGMRGIKARVAVMRKVAKFLFGLWNSDQPYDPDRVFTCESQYAGAPAG